MNELSSCPALRSPIRSLVLAMLLCLAYLVTIPGCMQPTPKPTTPWQSQRDYDRSVFARLQQLRIWQRWEEIIALWEKEGPAAVTGKGYPELIVAEAYIHLGRFEEALDVAAKVYEQHGNGLHEMIQAYGRLRDTTAVREHLLEFEEDMTEPMKAMKGCKMEFGSESIAMSSRAKVIAEACLYGGRWKKAYDYASRALESYRPMPSDAGQKLQETLRQAETIPEMKNHPALGLLRLAVANPATYATRGDTMNRVPLLFAKGKSAFHLGRPTEAEALFESAFAGLNACVPISDWLSIPYWEEVFYLARIKEALGKNEEAIKAYYDCLRGLALQRLSARRDRNRLTLARVYQGPFECAVDLLMREGRCAEGLSVAEQAKSRALVDLLAGKEIGKTSEATKLVRKWDQARARAFAGGSFNYAAAWGNGPAPQSAEAARGRLRSLDAELCSYVAGQWATADEVRASRMDGSTIVEYFQSDRATYVWVVGQTAIRGHIIEASRTQVAEKVREYRKTLTDLLSARRGPGGVAIAGPSAAKLTTKEEQLAKDLHRLLIEPVRSSINGDLVYFVPHGSLHYLPLHALHDGRQRLVEKWAIAYAPSATVLEWTQKRQPRASRKAVVLYDPDVGDPRYRLQFAESEANAIASLWPEVERRSGKQATESLLSTRGREFDIIHLACHGEYNPQAPLRSRLLLAGGDGEDGNLTAEEIYRLDLNAWLVVLSACETGLGELTRGDDVVGLTRGLLYAGTPTVVDSLWKVDDLATSFLMGEFYGNLKTMPKAEALRRAQLATMKEYPEPVFWAAFRVVGSASGV